MKLGWVITPLLVIGGIFLFFGLLLVLSALYWMTCPGLDEPLCSTLNDAHDFEIYVLILFVGIGITATGIVLRRKKKTIENNSEYSQYIDKSETNKNNKSKSKRDRFTTFTIITTLLFTISILLSVVPIWLKLPLSIVNYIAGLPLLPFGFFGGISGVGLYLVPVFIASLWVIVFLRSRVK